ncbi:MAG: BlaI/MecI/CopY family transcriptional regulator [Myxococcales bacterium]|nr:BlaI/MecI/CopY family transcriptional regulator [Myxococcales bacterium]
MLRLSDLALGELERDVLDVLWTDGALNPGAVHERVGAHRGISVNTVSSALKRLQDKGLLAREKVSHAYVYRAIVSRAELQRQLIDGIAAQFGDAGGVGLLAAFVDVAEERGEETLRRLEQMIAARLGEGGP